MAEIQSIAVTQTQNLSISKSVNASYERETRSSALSLALGQGREAVSSDSFERVFDVIDISDDARQKLLQDRADAERLAAFVRGERPQVLKNPWVIDGGQIRIDAAAAEAIERFSFTEEYELSFLQETTLSVETDEGSLEIAQSRLIEASFSYSVSLERSASIGTLQTSFQA